MSCRAVVSPGKPIWALGQDVFPWRMVTLTRKQEIWAARLFIQSCWYWGSWNYVLLWYSWISKRTFRKYLVTLSITESREPFSLAKLWLWRRLPWNRGIWTTKPLLPSLEVISVSSNNYYQAFRQLLCPATCPILDKELGVREGVLIFCAPIWEGEKLCQILLAVKLRRILQ